MIRKFIIALTGIAILAVLNFGIWRNEDLLENGRIVYFELAPVDPRSLMQGDFMLLNYRIRHIEGAKNAGAVILTLNDRHIAEKAASDHPGDLKPGEIRMNWHRDHRGRLQIRPDTFLFQEGEADRYAQAKYAEFRVAPDGRALLTGLADENLKPIQPE